MATLRLFSLNFLKFSLLLMMMLLGKRGSRRDGRTRCVGEAMGDSSRTGFSMNDYNTDVMQRMQAVQGHLRCSDSEGPSCITHLVWQRRNRVLQALQPPLSDLARHLIRKDYRKVLPKILQTRTLFKAKFKQLEKSAANHQNATVQSAKTWQQFRSCLQQKLHEIISGMLNELADRLAKRMQSLPQSNLLVHSIRIYSSVTGSYQQKLTLIQRLSPTIRTLSYIQNQMVQHSGDRQLSGSIWVLLYIFSFAFVQMFGKYITRLEKEEVLRIVKLTFIRNLALVAGSIQLGENVGKDRMQMGRKVDEWIDELSKNAVSGAFS